TGSGKSICLNSIICSFLFKAKPDELKLILIDPKKVEMSNYSGLPHLITPVVTDNKKAAGCLKWAVLEMENRYSLFAANAVKDFKSYNSVNPDKPLPQIVVIIDELADLMMVAPADVENAICRLAQMARAAGIHLIVATQRPSVNVITGLIKANIPSRIAFAVTSSIDSRTILDMGGAEKLLGRGDMLYHPSGAAKPIRVQGTFIDEKDIQRLVKYCCEQAQPKYFGEEVFNVAINEKSEGTNSDCDEDPLLYEAGQIIITTGQASTSFLQRRLRIGNPRAGRLMDILEAHGVVGPPEGAKPRTILMTMEQFNERFTNR
ncbi:MAG: DNA translocase FtsK, partial [Clostridia bacterium]|nr:DNA translocase FtsK [Clostridia bacterium]